MESLIIQVRGDSMLPRLRPRDEVIISPQNTYQLGDVVVFQYHEEGLLIHRVIQVFNRRYICKGDNSYRLEAVNIREILGKVVEVRRESVCFPESRIKIEPLDCFIRDSLHISTLYKKLRNRMAMEESSEYKQYYKTYLFDEEIIRAHSIKLLRYIYKGSPSVNTPYLTEIFQIFNHHRISELLSTPIVKVDTKSRLALKQKRSLNKDAYRLRFKVLQPVLEAIDFPYAVIKGLPLAQMAYLDESFRASSDVDLLISPKNINKLDRILTENGYIQGHVNDGTIQPYTRQQRIFYLSYSHQTAPYTKQIAMPFCPFIQVDLNFRLLWGENSCDDQYITEDFLANTIEKEVYGITYYTLDIERTLIQLCLHTYKEQNSLFLLTTHQGLNLRSFCDIFGLLEKNSVNSTLVTKLSKKYGFGPFIYYCLYYTAVVFDQPQILKPYEELRPDNEQLLNRFGLTNSEYKQWPLPFFDRLFCDSLWTYLQPMLTDRDRKKIELNRRYL